MITRRHLLSHALSHAMYLAVGAAAGAACAADETLTSPATTPRPTSDVPPTTLPTTLPTTTSTTTSTTASTTTSPSDPSTNSGSAPWAGADFIELDTMLAATNGEAFVILERGAVIHEWYRTDRGYARDVASPQKSVLSLLVGRAISEQLFTLRTSIDDLLGPSWTPHGQSAAITVEHLLGMTSGLDDQLAIVAEPGTTWLYSNAFARLFDVLTVTTGQSLQDLAATWLFDPVGADDADFRTRRLSGVAPVGLHCTAASLAAIGQGVLDASIPALGDDWYETSFASNPLNESYGALWWLNGRPSHRLPGTEQVKRPGAVISTAPADLVAALGRDDQKLYVSRRLGVVVARLGAQAYPAQRAPSFDVDLWALLTQLRG